MKILVTGATGLIGCHAAAGLREAGHTVRLLVRDASRLDAVFAPFGLSGGDFEVSVGALEDEGALDDALRGCSGLLHCAGRFSPDRRDAAALRQTNVEGTQRVLEAAERARTDAALERVVYVSSILALFPAPGPKMRASDEVASPAEMYAATKADAERVARAAQSRLPLTIVYPAAVQGPDDPTFSIGPKLVADALVEGSVLVTDGGLPTTDVRDLARVFVAIFGGAPHAERMMGPAFYVEHAAYHRLLRDLTGRDLRAQRLPGWLLRAMGRVGDWMGLLGRPVQLTSEAAAVLTRSVPVDDDEARRLLDCPPITAEDSFRDLIAWMVEAGHVPPEAAGRIGPGPT
jgi:nucleoside-diphosphate-sugar epimerase